MACRERMVPARPASHVMINIMEDLVKHWVSFVCQDVPWELAASVIKGMESLCKGVD